MAVTIRVATAQDAEAVAALGRECVAYLQSLGDVSPPSLSAEDYLRDGFGAQPAFAGLIAERGSQAIGYLLYCPAYDLDLGGRLLSLVDLFVSAAARRQGVARRLMEAAADIGRQIGGHALLWSVYTPNTTAAAFYEQVGAQDVNDLRFMHWSVKVAGRDGGIQTPPNPRVHPTGAPGLQGNGSGVAK
jgi:GNAT superfamily N-acetyltransferase